jgi:hypothetical protein
LRLGGERRDEEAASDRRHEGPSLHHWILPQTVWETGARRERAWSKPGRVHAGALLTGWAECSRVEYAAENANEAYEPSSAACGVFRSREWDCGGSR